MASKFFESSNVNDILSVAQKMTVVCKMLQPNQSFKQLAVVPFYQNNADNPTLFRIEVYGSPVLSTANDTWPASCAAEDNPFGITATQGEDILSSAEKALWKFDTLDYDGWTENDGIGV